MNHTLNLDQLDEALERARRSQALPPNAERRLLRLRAGLTLADVAGCLGVSGAAVSRYETGHRTPRGVVLDGYLAVLNRLKNEQPA